MPNVDLSKIVHNDINKIWITAAMHRIDGSSDHSMAVLVLDGDNRITGLHTVKDHFENKFEENVVVTDRSELYNWLRNCSAVTRILADKTQITNRLIEHLELTLLESKVHVIGKPRETLELMAEAAIENFIQTAVEFIRGE